VSSCSAGLRSDSEQIQVQKKSCVNINKEFPLLLGRKEKPICKINFTSVYDAARNEMQFSTEDIYCEEINYILLTTLNFIKIYLNSLFVWFPFLNISSPLLTTVFTFYVTDINP